MISTLWAPAGIRRASSSLMNSISAWRFWRARSRYSSVVVIQSAANASAMGLCWQSWASAMGMSSSM